jgi:hypothetical protein
MLSLGGITLQCAPCERLPKANEAGQHLAAIRAVYPELLPEPARQGPNEWPATVVRRVLLGDIVNYVLEWPGGMLRVNGFPGHLWAEGDTGWLHIDPRHVILVEPD